MRNPRSLKLSFLLVSLAFFTCSSSVIAGGVNAGDMAFRSSGSSHDSTGWVLLENGYLGTFIDVAVAGPVITTIKADGSIAEETLPIMHLHIGDSNEAWSVTDNGGSHTTYSDYVANFNLPAGMHTVRVEFVNDFNSVDRKLYLKSVTFGGATLYNSASSANTLVAADNYVDKYRKSTAKVTVTIDDSNVPEGTPVQVKLRRHAFNFGTAVYGFNSAPWAVPDPALESDYYNYQQFLDSHFNMIVPENAGKWAYNESTRDVVTMGTVDTMLDYADDHGLRARMHGVLWDYDTQEPDWVNTLQNQALTDPCAAAEYWDEMMERMQYFIADRAHRLTDIDGINESANRDLHTQIYGIEGIADLYNEMVAASAGQAKIAVNEYGILDGATYYRNWYREHIEDIMNAGGTVELIGIQDHTAFDRYDAVNVFQNLQLFAGFELPIIVTEFSLDDASSSYTNILTENMRLIFGNDMANGFVMWGFWDYGDWMWRHGSALVDENWNLTAMGTAYEQLMAQWDTDEVVYVDSNSQIHFDGFYGDYSLTIEGQVYSFTFAKGTGASEPVVRVLYVDDDAPGDPGPGNPDVSDPNENGSLDHPFDAIQEAINAAIFGDSVIVLDGTYTGNGNRDINFAGRPITVRSQNGPNACIIDCQATSLDQHRAFYFANEEDGNSVLEGLTITNGYYYDEYGGAVCCYENSSPRIDNCIFIGNTALTPGGAIGCLSDSEPTITNCRFSGNNSPFGGGICSEESSPTIRNCIFSDNWADSWGGAILCFAGSPTLQNCTFSNNTADYGGGLCFYKSTGTLTNCILWADTAGTGPELELKGSAPPSTVTVLYSDVEGGESAVNVESGCTLIWDPNNIELDPNFVDANHPNPNQRDYHLLPESPCINAGDPVGSYAAQTDIDGQPRVIAARVDIGADEFTYAGDLDYDGSVDLVDFAFLGAYWQETSCYGQAECVEADLNGDTDVSWGDLQLFVQNWLEKIQE